MSQYRCICKEYLQPGREDTLTIFILGEVYTYTQVSPREFSLTGRIRDDKPDSNDTCISTITLGIENFYSFMTDISEHRQNQLEKLI